MRTRLIAVMMTAVLPAAAIMGCNAILGREQEKRRAAAEMARQTSWEIGRLLDGIGGMLTAAAAIPALTDRNGPACEQGLRRIAGRMDAILGIMVLDEAGRLVCDSDGSPAGTSFSDRAYFHEAIGTSGFVVGGNISGRLSSGKLLPVAMPLAETGGVIVASIRLDWLQRRIQDRGLPPGGSVTVTDRDGVVLLRNPEPVAFAGAHTAGTVSLAGMAEAQVGEGAFPLRVSAGVGAPPVFAAIEGMTAAGAVILVLGALAALFADRRFVAVPVRQIARVADRWCAGDETARTGMRSCHGDIGLAGAALDRMLDELERRRKIAGAAEAERLLLMRELSHRAKNTFSVVQAIARQTFGRQGIAGYDGFSQRLAALAGAYDILVSGAREGGDIRDVVLRTLYPHHDARDGRVVFRGVACGLPAQAVLSLSMVVHELATNATKYGALSFENGRIDIEWRREGDRLCFLWTERNGRPVAPPERQGFGSRLIHSAFPAEFEPQSTASFAGGSLAFTLSFRLSAQEPR